MDASYVVSLVWAWLMRNPDHHMTYVAPYTQLRYISGPVPQGVCAVQIGGHYRRRLDYKMLLPALACVCKFERLVVPRGMGAPLTAHRQRWDEDGRIIPMAARRLVWA